MELRRSKNGRLLRCGYTTGSCAAAAAKAAAGMLLGGPPIEEITLITPKGISLTLPVWERRLTPEYACCGVRKDAGDDPDITDGILIYARVSRQAQGIHIDGGQGIGRITKPGLDQPVGAAAINRIPREMIARALSETAQNHGYTGGFSVLIEIPEGERLARHTFNPRLGIEGGLSILGTTGIVEPMSHRALADTIRLELRQLRAAGSQDLLLTPGNYGEAFAAQSLGLSLREHIACSNFIGETLDAALELGFKRILLIGHIGKLVKLGLGMMNTHSAWGDGRLETLLACALEAGGALPLLKGIAGSATTDAALILLDEAGLLEQTLAVLEKRITAALNRHLPEGVTLGYLCFTNAPYLKNILIQSPQAGKLIKIWRKQA